MEKVCAPNAILVFQIPQKVRSKEVEYNRAMHLRFGAVLLKHEESWRDTDQYSRAGVN